MTPQQVIEDIRHNEFGIGLPKDRSRDSLIRKLRNSLRLLSEELYSKDTHFVLELIQNAEDNSYGPNVTPKLCLHIRDDAIIVQNNELGFAEANVRSLCSVGESTKIKRLGYIGEKGIGFKSVFCVSDEPYVFSAGYSFSLPASHAETGLGYIVPNWIEDVPDVVDCELTNIVLPLNERGSRERDKCFDVSDLLLLFLKKLRSIELFDATGNCVNSLSRTGEGWSVSLSSTSRGKSRWRTVRRVFTVPSGLVEERRQDVTEAELVLAFPVLDSGMPATSPDQLVFAFLPVRSYGFRFAVQGDFVLASSREEILEDRPWNQWLKSHIPDLFAEAVVSFKSDEELHNQFLRYISESQEVSERLFGDVAEEIVTRLKSTECLLTAFGSWASPTDVFIVEPKLRALVDNASVKVVFGRDFVADTFVVPSYLVRRLGIDVFGIEHLLRLLQNEPWIEAKDDAWLAHLYVYLSELPLTKTIIESLRKAKIIRSEDGTLTSIESGPCFFPLDKRTTYGFEQELRLLSKDLWQQIPKPSRDAVAKVLRDIGVCRPDPAEIISEFILPIFETDTWKSKSDRCRVGAISYIKDHLHQYKQVHPNLDRLKNRLYIKMVDPDDNLYSRPSYMYLSKEYGCGSRLEQLFKGIDDVRFVDPIYLKWSLRNRLSPAKKKKLSRKEERETKQATVNEWRQFFQDIGVATNIRVFFRDYQRSSDDLGKVIALGNVKRNVQVLKLLESEWTFYRQQLMLPGTMTRSRVPPSPTPTEFGRLLRSSEWIPCADGTLRKPGDVFVDSSECRSVLGDAVPYLAVDIVDRRLVSDLGMCSEPSLAAVLDRLRDCSRNAIGNQPLLDRLYEFLEEQFDSHPVAIRSAFVSEALIGLPGEKNGKTKYWNTSDVFWNNASSLFEDQKGYLVSHWKTRRSFFVDRLQIRLSPGPDDYVALLRKLSADRVSGDETDRKIWSAYLRLNDALTSAEGGDAWWKDFLSAGLFWTEKNDFWLNEGDLYINDHDEFASVFADHPAVAWLKLPKEQVPRYSTFISHAAIPLLSQSVEIVEVNATAASFSMELSKSVKAVLPFLVRCLYFKHTAIFEALPATARSGDFSGARVNVCEDLEVKLKLKDEVRSVRRESAGCIEELFVRHDAVDKYDSIAIALANALGNAAGLAELAWILLSKPSDEARERWMAQKNIPLLPYHRVEVPDWEVDEHSADDEDQSIPNQDGLDNTSPDEKFETAGLTAPRQPVPETTSATGNGQSQAERPSGELPGPDQASDERRGGSGKAWHGPETQMRPPHQGEGDTTGQRLDENVNSDAGGGRADSEPQPRGESTELETESPSRNWYRVLARPEQLNHFSEPSEKTKYDDDRSREIVIAYEMERSRDASAAAPNQMGYDIESSDPSRGITRFIEIKGLLGRWTGEATVTMSGAQFDAARAGRSSRAEYWLYVVDGLGTDSPRVFPIPHAAAKVQRFFFQAQDWLAEADQTDIIASSEACLEGCSLPVVPFNQISRDPPTTPFVFRCPLGMIDQAISTTGLLECQPISAQGDLPAKGALVMVLASQSPNTEDLPPVIIGEFHWSLRQNLEGDLLWVEVSVRPKSLSSLHQRASLKIAPADWPTFRPYALCKPYPAE